MLSAKRKVRRIRFCFTYQVFVELTYSEIFGSSVIHWSKVANRSVRDSTYATHVIHPSIHPSRANKFNENGNTLWEWYSNYENICTHTPHFLKDISKKEGKRWLLSHKRVLCSIYYEREQYKYFIGIFFLFYIKLCPLLCMKNVMWKYSFTYCNWFVIQISLIYIQ